MEVSVSQNNKVSLFEGVVGLGAGYASYQGAQRLLKKPYGKYLLKELTSVPQDQNDAMWKAAQKAFKTSDLTNKKVKIVDLNSANFEKFKDEVIKKHFETKKNNKEIYAEKLLKKLENKQKKKLEQSIRSISKGENACYIPKMETVAVNSKKMAFSTFHEIGHSINHASKGFAGKLHACRNYFALLAPVLLITSMLKKKKAKEDKPKGLWDKTTTFIKENCGKLMFACMIPTIAEEGLASVNANKLAKKVLSPELLKKMNNLNFKAWTSYVAAATIMSGCGALAVWIKDRVAQPELANK